MSNRSLQRSSQGRGRFLVVYLVAVLAVFWVTTAHATLTFQSDLERICAPALPLRQTLLHWKPADQCVDDCFVWRLTCSNGRPIDLQTNIHPETTDWQLGLWSMNGVPVFVGLLTLIGFIVCAGATGRMPPVLLVCDGILVGYFLLATMAVLASITADPFGPLAVVRGLFLNGYANAALIILGILINLPPVWGFLEDLLTVHTGADAQLDEPAAFAHALMPGLNGFTDLGESAACYRRETERLRALKAKLDADTALAKSVIKHTRTQNLLTDQT